MRTRVFLAILFLSAALPLAPGQQTVETREPLVANATPPKHPTLPDRLPHKTATGTIRKVACSFPSVIEFRLVTAKGTLLLYNNSFAKIDLSVLGFDPEGPMDPCHQFEGMKAKVEYLPGRERGVAGQAMAVVLQK